jgi:hypothetical protein
MLAEEYPDGWMVIAPSDEGEERVLRVWSPVVIKVSHAGFGASA